MHGLVILRVSRVSRSVRIVFISMEWVRDCCLRPTEKIFSYIMEEFEDIKETIIIRISKINRQHNGKEKRTKG